MRKLVLILLFPVIILAQRNSILIQPTKAKVDTVNGGLQEVGTLDTVLMPFTQEMGVIPIIVDSFKSASSLVSYPEDEEVITNSDTRDFTNGVGDWVAEGGAFIRESDSTAVASFSSLSDNATLEVSTTKGQCYNLELSYRKESVKYLRFDGVDDYAFKSSPTGLDLGENDALEIEAKFKYFTETGTYGGLIGTSGAPNTNAKGFGFYISGRAPRINIAGTNGVVSVYSGFSLSYNEIHIVKVKVDLGRDSIYFYKDGTQVSKESILDVGAVSFEQQLRMGSNWAGQLKGDIYYVKIWKNNELVAKYDKDISVATWNDDVGSSNLTISGAQKVETYNGVVSATPIVEYGAQKFTLDSTSSTWQDTTLQVWGEKESGYYSFDGVDDYGYVADNDSLDLGREWTFQFKCSADQWARNEGVSSRQDILSKMSNGASYAIELLNGTIPKFVLYLYDESGEISYRYLPLSNVIDGDTYVFTVVHSDSLRLYQNGIKVSTTKAYSDNLRNSDGRLGIGSAWGSQRYLKGEIYWLRIFRRALSEPEIGSLSAQGAVLDLNESNTTETTWHDVSGNSNDATMHGATKGILPKLVIKSNAENSSFKIDNVSLKKDVDHFKVNPGDTVYKPIYLSTATVGNHEANIDVSSSAMVNPNYTSVVNWEVVPSSNILEAPTNLVATGRSNDILVTWTDPNVPDTIVNNGLGNVYNDWTKQGNLTVAGDDSYVQLTRTAGANNYASIYKDYDVQNNQFYKIKVNSIKGQATSTWLVVRGLNSDGSLGQYYWNQESTDNNASFEANIQSPAAPKLRVYLQMLSDAEGEVSEFRDYQFSYTAPSYDLANLRRLPYLNGFPAGEWTDLANLQNGITRYSHSNTTFEDTTSFNYRVRFVKGNESSDWSNADTARVKTNNNQITIDYYVSIDGSSSNNGTSENTSWDLATYNANYNSLASETVIGFKRGDSFNGNINVKDDLKLISYGEGSKPTFTLNNNNYVIDLTNKENVEIKDLHLVGRRFIKFENSNSNTIINCEMNHADSINATDVTDRPIYMVHSDRNVVKGNVIKGTPSVEYQDLFFITGSSQYNIIEYNIFRNSTHALLYVKGNAPANSLVSYSGDSSPHHNVIRHNYFYSIYHTGLIQLGGAYANLIEYNYFERTGTGLSSYQESGYPTKYGGNTRGLAMYIYGANYIVRNNIIRKSGAPISDTETPAIDMSARENADDVADRADSNRVYNNTFYHTYGVPIRVGVTNTPNFESYVSAVGNKFKNNLVNKTGADSVDFLIFRSYASGSFNPSRPDQHLNGNAFLTANVSNNLGYGGTYTGDYRVSQMPIEAYLVEESNDNIGNDGSIVYNPTVPENLNSTDWERISSIYSISGITELENQATFLTKVNGAVTNSTTVVVDDAKYFVNPTAFGNVIEGDEIKIKSNGDTIVAKITNINGNTLTLDTSITVANDSEIYISNNIGAVE